jgi:hypothetical protein
LTHITTAAAAVLHAAVYFWHWQDVFGYQEMFQVQASACPPALQVRLSCRFQIMLFFGMLPVLHSVPAA